MTVVASHQVRLKSDLSTSVLLSTAQTSPGGQFTLKDSHVDNPLSRSNMGDSILHADVDRVLTTDATSFSLLEAIKHTGTFTLSRPMQCFSYACVELALYSTTIVPRQPLGLFGRVSAVKILKAQLLFSHNIPGTQLNHSCPETKVNFFVEEPTLWFEVLEHSNVLKTNGNSTDPTRSHTDNTLLSL